MRAYLPGEIPVMRRNVREKWLWSKKPSVTAISDILRSLCKSISEFKKGVSGIEVESPAPEKEAPSGTKSES